MPAPSAPTLPFLHSSHCFFFHTLFLLIQLLVFFLEAISFLPFSSSPSPIFQLCLIPPEPEGTPSFI